MIDFYIDLFSCDLFFESWTRSPLNFAGVGFYVHAHKRNVSFIRRSLSLIRKGLPRNYKGRWHVLSANQSRASNRTGIRHYQGLRKAFRAAVTFWVAIVKREKESWTVVGRTCERGRKVETTHEQERLNGTGKWKRNGNNRDQRKNKAKRRKKSRRRRKKCGVADIMECSD